MTLGAMAVALLTAVSCSETETEITPTPGNDDQVALGITPNLKVDAGTKAATKSVVSGEAIAYDLAKYSDADCAPGLGILVTNNDATGWYTPDGTEYTGHHVWYMGEGNRLDFDQNKSRLFQRYERGSLLSDQDGRKGICLLSL